jgi:tight adherence protein C
MAFLFVIGILLLATAVLLLTRGALMTHLRVSSQLQRIETYGFNSAAGSHEKEDSYPSLRVRLNELAEKIGRSTSGRGVLAPVESRQLRAAGMYSLTPEAFQGYRVMATIGVPALLVLDAASGSSGATGVALVALSVLICWVLPPVFVRTRGQRRMDQVDRALPELIDVLIATVEAGLGFAGSLQLVASRFDGPLGQELRMTLQEQRMGLSTEQAMSNLLERCDTASVRAFARAIMQGESLGVSIGQMLRNLAVETRKRRRQQAREQIMKAPVKMLFPLVFLIFPALFIVLLYPAFVSLTHALGTH